MKHCKVIGILLFLLLTTKLYSQESKVDSLEIQRESLSGYFSQNKLFCDKLEEFIDLLDKIKRCPAKEYELILISIIDPACECKKDSLYTIRVLIQDNNFLSRYMIINSNEIYLSGGKLKGRYIFFSQKSIFGKLFRSDFQFIDVLKEFNPHSAEVHAMKYDELMFGGGATITIGLPFMDFFVNKNGDVVDVKYYHDDARGFVTYDNIKAYEKSFSEPAVYIPKTQQL